MKTCNECHRAREPGHFYKDRTTRDGLQRKCIDCQAADQRRRNKINAMREPVVPSMKRCSGCQRYLGSRSFYARSASRDGLQIQCKRCQNGYRADYYRMKGK